MSFIDVFGMIGFFLSFILLIYSVIILIKRREYEDKRILNGYNAFLLGIFALALYAGLKSISSGYNAISFLRSDSLLSYSLLAQSLLLPLFAISLFVGLLIFKEI